MPSLFRKLYENYEDKIAILVCGVFVECTNICARGGEGGSNKYFLYLPVRGKNEVLES